MKAWVIEEVLSSTMDASYLENLKAIDDVLSEDALYGNRVIETAWKKLPIFGYINSNLSSWMDYLNCNKCRKLKDNNYLYGYYYENGDYLIEIKRHFCVKPPNEITELNDFYQINPVFKKYGKGIKENPEYSPLLPTPIGKDEESAKLFPAHPHVKNQNLLKENIHIPDVKAFLEDFLKNGNFLKKHFSSRCLVDNPFNTFLELRERDLKLPEGEHKIQLTLVGEQSSEKNKTPSTHLYFLFPTVSQGKEKEERYKTLLHITKLGKEYIVYKGVIPGGIDPSTEEQILHLYLTKIKGDGDCGFGAIETTRPESLKLLRNAADTLYIRELVAPEIVKSLIDGTLPKEVKAMFSELESQYARVLEDEKKAVIAIFERLGFKEGEIKSLDELLLEKEISKKEKTRLRKIKQNISKVLKDMQQHAQRRDVYLGFLENFKSSGPDDRGWLTHSPNIKEEKNTGLYDAIAYLNKLNLYIWQLSEGQTQLALIHRFEGEKDYDNAHILHNGRDHYDRLKCREHEAKKSQVNSEKESKKTDKKIRQRRKEIATTEKLILDKNNKSPKMEKKKKVEQENDSKAD